MGVAGDLTGARIVVWPGTGNEWYGFGMNAGMLNYNTPRSATHKFYCGTTVRASISSSGTTFNNSVTCGTDSLTCGTLTCVTGMLVGNSIATTD